MSEPREQKFLVTFRDGSTKTVTRKSDLLRFAINLRDGLGTAQDALVELEPDGGAVCYLKAKALRTLIFRVEEVKNGAA